MKWSALGAALAVSAGFALLPLDAAQADCTPASASNITGTCTGTTLNQAGGAPGTSAGSNGYGAGIETGLTIIVVSGASVTGTATGTAFSDGTVINSGSITGNSAFGVYGGITINVSNSGTITGLDDGVFAAATVANVVNSGTITGTVFDGVFGSTDANVVNSGTIIGGLRGVEAINNANVTNSGTITGGTYGVVAGGVANVTNSGTITGGTFGISASTANVTNSGTITGGTFGISASTANVTNSGTISGLLGINGATANIANFGTITGSINGINVANANVTNSGTISGNIYGITATTANVTNSGTITGGTIAIIVGGGGNVTNAGTISGPTAIQFSGAADTLTLLTGSKIIGAILLGGGGDTVNIRAVNQNLTFDTLVGATVTGTVPYVVSGNQIATIDPTPFAANGRVLGDFTRSVSQVVPDFGNQPAATTGGPIGYAAAPPSPASVVSSAFDNMPGRDAYAADQAVFKAPTVVQADGTAIWARAFGGYRVQQGDGGLLLRTSNTFYGGAIGFERQVRPDLRVGAFAGGGTTRSTVDLNMGDTNSNLGFGGLYARYFQGAYFLYAAIQGGGSHNDEKRNINNNLAAGGLETAKGSYSGWYVSPELKLGTKVALGRVMDSSYTLTPSIGVRYLYGSFGGYTETGSTANLTVSNQTAQTVEERAELKLTRTTLFGPDSALLLDITGGALGIQRVGSNIVNAALLGQSIPFATPGKDNVYGGYGGLGMEWRTANVSLFASGEYLWLSDSSTIVGGKGGVRVSF